jgi:chromosome segregation ATPase
VFRFFSRFAVQGKPGVLEIIQRNDFRDLKHLILAFQEGTETELREHLAEELERFKRTSTRSSRENDDLLSTVGDLKSSIQSITEERDRIVHGMDDTIRKRDMDWEEKLAKLRDECQQGYSEQQGRMESTRQEEVGALKEELRLIRDKLDTLRVEKEETVDARVHFESKSREEETRRRSFEEQVAALSEERDALRKENLSLDQGAHALQKELVDAKVLLSAAQQRGQDQDGNADTLRTLLDSVKQQRSSLEDTLEMAKKSNKSLEDKLRVAVGEIEKGNTVIETLKEQVSLLRGKLSTKATVVKKQEALLQEKEVRIREKDTEIVELTTSIREKGQRMMQLEEEMQRMSAKLVESRDIIEKNESAIRWLQKELTESQLSPSLRHGPLMEATFATTAQDSSRRFGKPSTFSTQRTMHVTADEECGSEPFPVLSASSRMTGRSGGATQSYKPPSAFASITKKYLDACDSTSRDVTESQRKSGRRDERRDERKVKSPDVELFRSTHEMSALDEYLPLPVDQKPASHSSTKSTTFVSPAE